MKERIADIGAAIEKCSRIYPFLRIDIIERTQSLYKSRLWLSENLYIQIYANDKHPKRSFALISFDRRIFGKDFIFGQWHRHRFDTPQRHDKSSEGSSETNVTDFIANAVMLAFKHSLL